MVRSKLLAVLFVCSALSVALAQDPTKVESNHYRLAFANEHVEVISVHYGPHEKSGIHDHPGGVVVNITKAHLRFTDQSGHVQDVWAEPGEARWFPPVKHRVENMGETPYNGVYIAIRNKSASLPKNGTPLDAETQKAIAQVVASLTR